MRCQWENTLSLACIFVGRSLWRNIAGRKTSTRPGSQEHPHEITPLPYHSPSAGCLRKRRWGHLPWADSKAGWLQRWPEVWIKQTLGCQLMVWLISYRPEGNKSKVWIAKVYGWIHGDKTGAVLQMKLTENYLLQRRSPARWTGWWILRMPANLCPSTRLQVAQQLPIRVPPVSRMAALNGQHLGPPPSSLIQSASLRSAQPLQLHRPMRSPQYWTVPPLQGQHLCKNQYCLIPHSLPACLCHIRYQKTSKMCNVNSAQEIHFKIKVSSQWTCDPRMLQSY